METSQPGCPRTCLEALVNHRRSRENTVSLTEEEYIKNMDVYREKEVALWRQAEEMLKTISTQESGRLVLTLSPKDSVQVVTPSGDVSFYFSERHTSTQMRFAITAPLDFKINRKKHV